MSEADFQQLVARQYAPLYRFALSLSKSEADAADLTQPLQSKGLAVYDTLSRISKPAPP